MASSNVGGRAVAIAREAEGQGFDGITFGDTQCQNPDAFIGLTAAAAATASLKVGVGVTNPVTRHPAAVACSIATVQLESGGRAVLGVGRGDSAVRRLGLPAATLAELEHFLVRLQAYLSGDLVSEDGPLAQLTWIEALSLPKVPVDVAASGPGVIGVGARLAERVTFNVGADPGRMRQSIDLAREAPPAAGLAPDGVSFGAYVNVAPYPDPDVARELIKPVTAVYARFSGPSARSGEQLDSRDAEVIQAVAEHYDMSRHGGGAASHLAYLSARRKTTRTEGGGGDECCLTTEAEPTTAPRAGGSRRRLLFRVSCFATGTDRGFRGWVRGVRATGILPRSARRAGRPRARPARHRGTEPRRRTRSRGESKRLLSEVVFPGEARRWLRRPSSKSLTRAWLAPHSTARRPHDGLVASRRLGVLTTARALQAGSTAGCPSGTSPGRATTLALADGTIQEDSNAAAASSEATRKARE
jgi:5,10-methylenetetrahydromethanopterin reductase